LGQSWREDSTNLERDATRNRIRLDLLPYVAAHINPGVEHALFQTAALLAQDESYLAAQAKGALDAAKTEAGYDRFALAQLPPALKSRALFLALNRAGVRADIESRHIALLSRFLGLATGSRLDLPHCRAFLRNKSICFMLGQPTDDMPGYCVPFVYPGETRLPTGRFVAQFDPGPIQKDRRVAYLDAEQLPRDLVVRLRRPGDRFHPVGAPGAKKLKDILIDRKIPRDERNIPLLCDGQRILFGPGLGIDASLAVRPATAQILRVNYITDTIKE
jgi:tRNA(Ile)-lysidine synthase